MVPKMDVKKMLGKLVFLTAVLLPGLGASAVANTKQIELVVGTMRTEKLGEIIRIAVAREDVLSASVLDNGELLLIPQESGRTELTVWTQGERRHQFTVNVVSRNMSRDLSHLRSIFRGFPDVSFRSEGETILAEGRLSEEDFGLFSEIIPAYGNVLSLVRPRAVDMKDMIDIEVRVLEMTTGLTRELGVQWDSSIDGPSIGFIRNFRTNNYYAFHGDNNRLANQVFDDGSPLITSRRSHMFSGIATSISSRINLLQEDGDAKILAEPFLSTQSGQPATFQAGGSYPIPYTTGLGAAGVQMQDYGILLDIEPVSDGDGNILAKVRAELSSIDFSVVVDGIPGLLSRNTESVVNLASGETIVISGLLQAEDSRSNTKVPFLGDIPILGRLFMSENFNQGRTELVILATPRIRESGDRNHQGISEITDHMRKVRYTGDMSKHLVY